jgi:primosomal replication protein N
MPVNKVVLTGTVSEAGPKLSYLPSGAPEFKTFIPVYVYGSRAETVAETVEPGMAVLIDGKLAYKSMVKAGEKAGGLVVTAWAVELIGAESPAMPAQMG